MKNSGTIHELMAAWVKEFKKDTPEQQEETRKQIYEELTGKPYRPASKTAKSK